MLRFGCADMSDGEFLRSFEDGSVPPRNFHHGDHLRVAWLLLERLPFEDALDAVRLGLQTLARRAGVPGNYHETVTRGWMVLLGAAGEHSFDEYVARLPETGNPLHAFWSKDVLGSAAARAGWVGPDVEALPPLPARQATLKRDNAGR